MKKYFFATLVAFAIIVNSVGFVSAQSGRVSQVSAKDLFNQSKAVSIRVEEGFSSESLIKRLVARFLRRETKWDIIDNNDNEDFVIVVSREITYDSKKTQRDAEQTQLNRAAKKNIRETERAGNEAKRNVKRQLPRKVRGIAGIFTDSLIDRQTDKRIRQTEDLIQSDKFVQERMNVIVTVSFVRPSDNKISYQWVGSIKLKVVTREESGVTQTKVADDWNKDIGLAKGQVISDKHLQTINELAFLNAFEKSEEGDYINQTVGR